MNDLYIQGLRINWDSLPQNSYVHNIPAIKSITELNFDKPITFFVGENGSGKSTSLYAPFGRSFTRKKQVPKVLVFFVVS